MGTPWNTYHTRYRFPLAIWRKTPGVDINQMSTRIKYRYLTDKNRSINITNLNELKQHRQAQTWPCVSISPDWVVIITTMHIRVYWLSWNSRNPATLEVDKMVIGIGSDKSDGDGGGDGDGDCTARTSIHHDMVWSGRFTNTPGLVH